MQIPSNVSNVYWLFAEREIGDYPCDTSRSGKWLIFVPEDNVDEVWAIIKQATEKGLLGQCSKVSTAKPNSNATSKATKVICVYTYDWTDTQDLKQVRQSLRDLGITQKIAYKTNLDTQAGRYSVSGDSHISKYYE